MHVDTEATASDPMQDPLSMAKSPKNTEQYHHVQVPVDACAPSHSQLVRSPQEQADTASLETPNTKKANHEFRQTWKGDRNGRNRGVAVTSTSAQRFLDAHRALESAQITYRSQAANHADIATE